MTHAKTLPAPVRDEIRFRRGQVVELSELDALLNVAADAFGARTASLVEAMRAKSVSVRVPTRAEWAGDHQDIDTRVTFAGLYSAQIQRLRRMDRDEEFLMARRYELLKARTVDALARVSIGADTAQTLIQRSSLELPAGTRGTPTAKTYALACLHEVAELRNRYVEGALYMVMALAHRYRGLGVDVPDLIQEGNTSLFQAIEGFDWRRDVRFKTYAQYWIHQAILKLLYNASRTVRVPIWVQKALRKINRARESLRNQTGREPSTAEIGAICGMTAERVEELQATRRYAVSLDAELPGEQGASMVQLLPDLRAVPVTEMIEDGNLAETLREVMSDLPPREQLILNRRFGLLGTEPETLGEIAVDLGITAERVRQLQNAALGRLQKPLKLQALQAFSDA